MQTKTHNTKEQKGTIKQIVRVVVFLFCFITFPTSAFASTPINETLSGNITWSPVNSPYIVNYLSIPANASLTILPGTVIKIGTSVSFIVTGTLTSIGTSVEPIIITSLHDDLVGGDSNGDGAATTPAAGDWTKITINAGGTATFTNTIIRYGGGSRPNYYTGGYFANPLIENNGGTLSLTNTDLIKSGNNGLEQLAGTTTMTNSTISDVYRGIVNYGGALTIGNNTFTNVRDYDVSVHATTYFHNEGGNTGGRGIFMNYSISGIQTWAKDNLPYVVTSVSIPSRSSLVIAPGAIVKATTDTIPFSVDGSLIIGSLFTTDDVHITSIKDDSVGGDTNNDGTATVPTHSDWLKITMSLGSTVSIAHTSIKYGGASPGNYYTGGYFTLPLIENNGGVLTLNNVELAQSGNYGILQNSGTTTMTNSLLSHIAQYGVTSSQGYLNVSSTTFATMSRGIQVSGGSVEMERNTFTNLTSHAVFLGGSVAFQNHGGNIGSTGFFLSGEFVGVNTLPKDGLVYLMNYVSIPLGSSLTILPGAIVKMPTDTAPLTVHGVLNIGSSTSPEKTYITSMNDDSVGGDTNNDGTATVPTHSDWLKITMSLGSTVSIAHTSIKYGGASPGNYYTGGYFTLPLIENNGGVLTLNNVELAQSGNYGILQNSGSTTIRDSVIMDNSYGVLMYGGTLSANNSSIHGNTSRGIYNGSTNIIDATNNYWGSAMGPTHATNPAGTGDRVSDNVTFTPWLGAEPGTTTPPTTCVTDCYSNVLFLPGLEASNLRRPEFGHDKYLWLPDLIIPRTEELFLTSGGISQYADIYASDIIETAYGTKDIYHSFVTQMDSLKSKGTIVDWEAIPYDWRLSLENLLIGGRVVPGGISYAQGTTTPYIIQELRRLASTSKTEKVTIIAHSNGGLLTKALTNKLGSEAGDLIDKIIFVAVPQAGTPQAIGAILHGADQGLPFDSLPVFFTPENARKLALNMPSAYNLLPSYDYFTYVQDPAVTFDTSALLAPWRTRYGGEIHSSVRLHTFIADQSRVSLPVSDTLNFPTSGNETLLNNAEALHDILDNWIPPQGVQLTEIAGWGEDTLATINYGEGKERICIGIFPAPTCSEVIYRSKLEYSLKEVVEGDGTVVVPSALWTAISTGVEKYWVNLREYNTFPNGKPLPDFLSTKHADILEILQLRMLINNILTNSTSTSIDFITTSQPVALVGDHRLRFVLHSPLNLSATDNLGNIISSTTSTIPGSRFTRYGEVQILKVPKGTPITLTLDGYATGSFTLDMEEIDGANNVIASSTIEAIPNATSTKAQISFTEGTLESATPLLVDYDNNGTTDFTIAPKLGATVTLDLIPPEAHISLNPITKNLLINGIDETSSTTVTTTSTSSLITDEAGNTLTLMYKKFKQEKHELKFDLQTLVYNGIPTSTTSTTVLKYEWSTDTQGNIRELQQKATIGAMKVEAHYDAKKNSTTIERKLMKKADDDDTKEKKEIVPGLVILSVVTEKGVMRVDY